MLTTLIVEDDLTQLKALENILSDSFSKMRFFSVTNYDDAIDILENERIDFFLLDIELSQKNASENGIALGEYIRSFSYYKHTPILFLTGRQDKIGEALNSTHCYNYLVKPYSYDILINSINELLSSPMVSSDCILKLKDINGIYFRISSKDICYIQSSSKVLFLQSCSRIMKTRQYTLAELKKELPDYFYQCHKSFIVNLKRIKHYDKSLNKLYISDCNTSIPVGRKYKEGIERILENEDVFD